jgi:hypothetical protein
MNKTGASKNAAGLKMQSRTHETYERLIRRAASVPAIPTIVVHPSDKRSLRGAVEAAAASIVPILVGPLGKIRSAAKDSKLDISRFELVDAEYSHAAAVKAVGGQQRLTINQFERTFQTHRDRIETSASRKSPERERARPSHHG